MPFLKRGSGLCDRSPSQGPAALNTRSWREHTNLGLILRWDESYAYFFLTGCVDK